MVTNATSRFQKVGLFVTTIVVVAVGFFLFTTRRWGHFVVSVIEYVAQTLSSRSGISLLLVYGIVVIVTIPFFWAVGKYMWGLWFWLRGLGPSLRLYRSPYGMIIVAYVGLYFIAMYFASRNAYAYKWCVETPEGIQTFDSLEKDPIYGIEAKPCTFDQIVTLRKDEHRLVGPQRVNIGDANHFEFFDSVSQKPRVWYHRTPTGEYELYDRMGNYPGTGEPLRPMDLETRKEIIEQQAARASAEVRRDKDSLDEKYVNTAVTKLPGKQQIAFLIFSNDQDQILGLEGIFGRTLSSSGYAPITSFFKPAFIREGLAQRLFAGDWEIASRLEIRKRVDLVIVGQARIGVTESTDFAGLVTTDLDLELKCLNLALQTVCGEGRAVGTGADYKRASSLENAEDKIKPDIEAFVKTLRLH